MTVTIHENVDQGSDLWMGLRCGLLTASEMKLIITPKLKVADNDKSRAHVWELMAQRITKYVEPSYISDDMIRGHEDEIEALIRYQQEYGKVADVGFITNDDFGFTIGYSPDGLVGDDGLIEAKSRRQRFQAEVITEQTVPEEHIIQCQTGLMVSKRKWLDYISYCGGMNMITIRVFPDPVIQDAILGAATQFEKKLAEMMDKYNGVLKSGARLLPTERKIIEEMI